MTNATDLFLQALIFAKGNNQQIVDKNGRLNFFYSDIEIEGDLDLTDARLKEFEKEVKRIKILNICNTKITKVIPIISLTNIYYNNNFFRSDNITEFNKKNRNKFPVGHQNYIGVVNEEDKSSKNSPTKVSFSYPENGRSSSPEKFSHSRDRSDSSSSFHCEFSRSNSMISIASHISSSSSSSFNWKRTKAELERQLAAQKEKNEQLSSENYRVYGENDKLWTENIDAREENKVLLNQLSRLKEEIIVTQKCWEEKEAEWENTKENFFNQESLVTLEKKARISAEKEREEFRKELENSTNYYVKWEFSQEKLKSLETNEKNKIESLKRELGEQSKKIQDLENQINHLLIERAEYNDLKDLKRELELEAENSYGYGFPPTISPITSPINTIQSTENRDLFLEVIESKNKELEFLLNEANEKIAKLESAKKPQEKKFLNLFTLGKNNTTSTNPSPVRSLSTNSSLSPSIKTETIEELQSNNDKLEKEVEEIAGRLGVIEDEYTLVKTALEFKVKKIKSLLEEIEKKNDQLEEKEKVIKETNDYVISLEQMLTGLGFKKTNQVLPENEKIMSLSLVIDQWNLKNSSDLKEDVEEDSVSLPSDSGIGTSVIMTAEREKDIEKEVEEDYHQPELEKKQRLIVSLQDEIDLKNEELDSLNISLDATILALKEWTDKFIGKNATDIADELNARVDPADYVKKTDFEAKEKELKLVEGYLANTRKNLTNVENDLIKVQQQIKNLTTEQNDLQTRYDEVIAANLVLKTTYETDLKVVADTRNKVESDLVEEQTKFLQLEKHLEKEWKRANYLQTERDELEKDWREEKKHADDVELELTRTNKKNTKLTNANRGLKARVEKLKTASDDLQIKIIAYKEQLTTVNNFSSILSFQIANLSDNEKQLQTFLKKALKDGIKFKEERDNHVDLAQDYYKQLQEEKKKKDKLIIERENKEKNYRNLLIFEQKINQQLQVEKNAVENNLQSQQEIFQKEKILHQETKASLIIEKAKSDKLQQNLLVEQSQISHLTNDLATSNTEKVQAQDALFLLRQDLADNYFEKTYVATNYVPKIDLKTSQTNLQKLQDQLDAKVGWIDPAVLSHLFTQTQVNAAINDNTKQIITKLITRLELESKLNKESSLDQVITVVQELLQKPSPGWVPNEIKIIDLNAITSFIKIDFNNKEQMQAAKSYQQLATIRNQLIKKDITKHQQQKVALLVLLVLSLLTTGRLVWKLSKLSKLSKKGLK